MAKRRSASRLLLAAAALLGVVAACSRPPPLPTIGPEGGTATAPDGAKVVVPPGALSSHVPIQIEFAGPGAPDLPPGLEGAGQVYALLPHGTTFAEPVSVVVPLPASALGPAQTPEGPGPYLMKTDANGSWYELAGAAISTEEMGETLSAQTTSFSFLTTATGQRKPNSSGLYRTWYFWGLPKDEGDPVLVVPPPEDQPEDEAYATHRFGPLAAGFEDGFADAEVYSSADGNTYWAYTEAPGDELPDQFIGSKVEFQQSQSFRKEDGDATLKFTITAAQLMGKQYGGADILPYQCVGSPVCVPSLIGKVMFSALVFTSGMDPHTLLRTDGHAVLKANLPQLGPSEPLWLVSTGTSGPTPLWSIGDGDFAYEQFDRDGFIRLDAPITMEVDLSGVEVGELVTIEFRVKVETLDQVQGETYMAGFFRDPVSLEGAELEYAGLTPVPDLQLPPEEDEAEACTTSIDPAAGTIQFEEADYDLLEMPFGGSYAVVTREGGSTGDVSVRLRTHDGTAIEGQDYYQLDRVVFFPDGDEQPRWIEIPIAVDDVVEPVETFTLRLDDPRGCVGMGAPAVATINVYDNDTPADPNAGTYTVGGTVTGLMGSGLVLNGFGTREVTVNENGPFTFEDRWPDGLPYDVVVTSQPTGPSQVCSVANGSGTVQGANVTDVLVTCAPPGEQNPYLDPAFGAGGKVSGTLGLGSNVVDLVVQDDGKTLVLDERSLRRFTSAGALDAGFGQGGSVPIAFLGTSYDRAQAMALQPDGKIVVVGDTQTSVVDENGNDWAVARYLPSGELDASFGTGGVVVGDLGSTPGVPYHEGLEDVAVQADGKLVVGGTLSRFGQGADLLVMRLSAAGQLDGTFGSGGVATSVDIAGDADIGERVAIDGDGRILIAGRVAPSGGSDPDIGILRYLPNGDLDTSFGDQGVLRDVTDDWDQPFDLLVLDDDKVLVAGLLNRSIGDGGATGLLALYTAAGEPDTDFGDAGRVLVEELWSIDDIVSKSGGGYLAVGSAPASGAGEGDFVVVSLTDGGALDAGFGDAGLVIADFYAALDYADVVGLQEDGKALVAGSVKNGSTTELGLMRVLP